MSKTATVTARVPSELKAQSYRVLEDLGSSPTELINQALAYVLENHQLPLSGKEERKERLLDNEARTRLQERTATMRLRPLENGMDILSLDNVERKALIAESRGRDYEALS